MSDEDLTEEMLSVQHLLAVIREANVYVRSLCCLNIWKRNKDLLDSKVSVTRKHIEDINANMQEIVSYIDAFRSNIRMDGYDPSFRDEVFQNREQKIWVISKMAVLCFNTFDYLRHISRVLDTHIRINRCMIGEGSDQKLSKLITSLSAKENDFGIVPNNAGFDLTCRIRSLNSRIISLFQETEIESITPEIQFAGEDPLCDQVAMGRVLTEEAVLVNRKLVWAILCSSLYENDTIREEYRTCLYDLCEDICCISHFSAFGSKPSFDDYDSYLNWFTEKEQMSQFVIGLKRLAIDDDCLYCLKDELVERVFSKHKEAMCYIVNLLSQKHFRHEGLDDIRALYSVLDYVLRGSEKPLFETGKRYVFGNNDPVSKYFPASWNDFQIEFPKDENLYLYMDRWFEIMPTKE